MTKPAFAMRSLYRHAFPSLRKLKEWFTARDLAKLGKHNYAVAVYAAKEYVLLREQVLFAPTSAILLRKAALPDLKGL